MNIVSSSYFLYTVNVYGPTKIKPQPLEIRAASTCLRVQIIKYVREPAQLRNPQQINKP